MLLAAFTAATALAAVPARAAPHRSLPAVASGQRPGPDVMVGAATLAALDAIGREIHPVTSDDFRERALALIDEAMTFIGAGVAGLVAASRP